MEARDTGNAEQDKFTRLGLVYKGLEFVCHIFLPADLIFVSSKTTFYQAPRPDEVLFYTTVDLLTAYLLS